MIRAAWVKCENYGETLALAVTTFESFLGVQSSRSSDLDELKARSICEPKSSVYWPGDVSSDFRYDELINQLKARGLNSLTRATLEQLCRDEDLFATPSADGDRFLSVAVRAFWDRRGHRGTTPENTLVLTDDFRLARCYLRDDLDWQTDIGPKWRRSCGPRWHDPWAVRLCPRCTRSRFWPVQLSIWSVDSSSSEGQIGRPHLACR